MFPSVYNIPFHYANPVTGRTEVPRIEENTRMKRMAAARSCATGHVSRNRGRRCARSARRSKAVRTTELYAPLQPKEPYQNVTVTRDVSYGPHERHVLDVFVSPDTTAKSASPWSCSFTAAGSRAARSARPTRRSTTTSGCGRQSNGLVGVTINYRLAPQFPYPAGIEDLTRLVAWLKANIKSTAATRTRFSCGVTPLAPRTPRTTSRA